MKQKRLTVYIEHVPTREELRIEKRWRTLDNILNILIGLTAIAAMFYAGWLVGSGSVRWPV